MCDIDKNRINTWYGFYNIGDGYAITDGNGISYQVTIKEDRKKDFGCEHVLVEGECYFLKDR